MPDFDPWSHLIETLIEKVVDLSDKHGDLEARLERMFRKGKVTDVDPDKKLYRQEIGEDKDGTPMKSPWRPYTQVAGGRKEHSMPTVGELYMLVSPDGDFRQGIGLPHGWTDDNPSPSSDPNADVTTRGKTKDTNTETSRKIESEGASVEINGNDITMTAKGKITLKAPDVEIIEG